MDERIIKSGALFTVSTGEYSDYSVAGVFRALRDIRPFDLRDQWLEDHPAQRERYAFDYGAFFAWVTRQGYCEAVESQEWHLADYSCSDEMTLTRAGPDGDDEQ